jgi:tetratricopeptide (TPR) repeat protein
LNFKSVLINSFPKCLLKTVSLLGFFIGTLVPQNISPINEIDKLLLKEDYSKASVSIESMLLNTHGTADLYYKLGLSYQKQYLYDNAIKAYSKSIKLDSNLTQAYISIGDCYNELGNPGKALSVYEKVFTSDSTNIKAGLKLASTLAGLQKYQYASDIFTKIAVSDSSNSYIYRQLGLCAEKLDTIGYGAQKYDTLSLPVKYYLKALHLNNNDMISVRQLVNYYVKQKWTGAAIYFLKNRIEKDPDSPILNTLLGDVYFSGGKYVEALHNYSVSMRNGDTTEYLLQKTGIAHYLNAVKMDSMEVIRKNVGYTLAVNILEKSLLLEDNPVTYYYLAQAEQKLGNYKESIDYFNKAIKIIIPGFLPEIYLHLGECYSSLYNYTEMLKSYKAAYLMDPDKSALLLYIAEVYEMNMSDKTSAVAYYKEYLKNDTLNNDVTARVKQKINKLTKKD